MHNADVLQSQMQNIHYTVYPALSQLVLASYTLSLYCTQFSREKSANCPGFKVKLYSVVWQATSTYSMLSLKTDVYRQIVATVVACAQLCNTM